MKELKEKKVILDLFEVRNYFTTGVEMNRTKNGAFEEYNELEQKDDQ